MKRQNLTWTLAAVALLNACSLVLDFDRLHGASANASAVESHPDAGKVECVPKCVSKGCSESTCVAGRCVETPRSGFFAEELADSEQDFVSDEVFRSSTTAGDGKLFSAVYGVFDGKRDIIIRSLDTVTGELQQTRVGAKVSSDAGIASPAALVVAEKYLNVYFATRPVSEPSVLSGGQVWRLRYSSSNLDYSKDPFFPSDTSNFRFNGDTLGPAAGLSEGLAYVVWPGCTVDPKAKCLVTEADSGLAGIYAQKGNNAINVSNPSARFSENAPITDLVALAGSKPGAAWLADTGNGLRALRTAYEGFAAQVVELKPLCNLSAGFTGRVLSSATTPVGDLLSLWASGSANGRPANEWYQLNCASAPCTLDEKASKAQCDAPAALTKAHSSAVTTYQPRNAESVYLIAAHVAQTGSNAGVTLSLSPLTQTAEAGAPAAPTTTLLPSPAAEKLDLPSIAVSDDGHALVSWQTRTNDDQAVLHLSRQRVCTGAAATR